MRWPDRQTRCCSLFRPEEDDFPQLIYTDSLSSLMNLEENNNAYNDPDV